ncbi:hypothetical protein [Frankia sp. KB5]|uniref:hypothetical protein n=2 Tax=Frankia sp. KB5 TaxID=683318 RepID=UPI001056D771|nr:hypothetical protein [Frankia sp. KB5]
MCDVNHQGFTRPGYLIDVKAESIAAEGALFTRALAHHDDAGLTADQIRGLLDISRDYHAEQLTIRLRMAQLGEQAEQKRGRLTPERLAERKALLDERAELFRADEELFFTYAARGQDLLTDEQLELISDIYHAEKDEGLSALERALSAAIGPNYQLTRTVAL